VAVLSRFAAERLWPNRDPIGQRFKLGVPLDPEEADAAESAVDAKDVEWVTVVGVVENVAQRALVPDPERSPLDPDIYFSMAQLPGGTVTGLVRTAGASETLLPTIRREVGALDPGMPVFLPETLSERLAAETAQMRFSTSLLGLFAVLALLLAAVGIYGVVTYQVVERVQEIGIRMALGAQRSEVVRQVVGGSMLGVATGVALGLVLSLGLTRLMEGLLFEVSARDPWTLLRVTATLLGVALLSSLLPARRASRVDPAVALRGE
jgi:predicted lysophospholipase L1 biosynthesis ABC-type transport system permease subunit